MSITVEKLKSAQERSNAGADTAAEEGVNDCRSGETQVHRSSGGGGGGGERSSVSSCDGFTVDALRDLVRCLCGVVVGRWKQAFTSTAKAPKKVWVVHAMEAVHALVRTLEVGGTPRVGD